MAEGNATNWLDVLKSSFWPLVTMVTVAAFYAPLFAGVNRIAQGLDNAQEITVGYATIKFRSTAQIPKATASIADALSKLSSSELLFLIGQEQQRYMHTCPLGALRLDNIDFGAEAKERINKEASIWKHLAGLGLAKSRPENKNYDWCTPGATVSYSLSQSGDDVKNYVANAAIGLLSFDKA